jgi:hypothetical protein
LTLQANSKHRLIFRIAWIVTYLVLFATQLSGKFYFLASYPCYSSKTAASKARSMTPVKPGARNIFVLSLDKRYDGKHLFPHPEPTFRVNPPLPAPGEYAEAGPAGIPDLFRGAATQRGPPFTA